MLGSPTGLIPEREQALLVPLGQRLADRLLQDGAVAEPLDHQRGRRLALAEAGHPHLPRQARGRRAGCRDRRRSAGTSTSTRTRESGSSVTVGLHRARDPRAIGPPAQRARSRAQAGRTATPKSIAKARPRPSGPVTSQALRPVRTARRYSSFAYSSREESTSHSTGARSSV